MLVELARCRVTQSDPELRAQVVRGHPLEDRHTEIDDIVKHRLAPPLAWDHGRAKELRLRRRIARMRVRNPECDGAPSCVASARPMYNDAFGIVKGPGAIGSRGRPATGNAMGSPDGSGPSPAGSHSTTIPGDSTGPPDGGWHPVTRS